jgi:hypothetical protein
MASDAGAVPLYLDAHTLDHSPASFNSALRQALSLDPGEDVVEHLARSHQRYILLLDTYEQFGPMDDWLRDQFLPQLPDDVFVVLAGRNPPALGWRVDPGWQPLMRAIVLRNLSPAESRSYLSQRQIPLEQQQAVLDFTYGHPLALSLVADAFDQRPDLRFQPGEAPNVIQTLLERFIQKVPTPAHRLALEVCALAHMTTESILRVALAQEEVHDIFDWLRGLSFITSGSAGLFPHDLVREALTSDLRWRNPDRYIELHNRVRTYYASRLQETTGKEQRRVLIEYNYLHRDNPTWKPFFEWQESGGVWTDTMSEDDLTPLLEMVARHEGEEAMRHASLWLGQYPQSVLVFRDGAATPAGFLLMLPLHEIPAEQRTTDPATAAAWDYLYHRVPLRPGEKATHFRFWMARDTYQNVSATQTRVFLNAAQHYLTTSGLAFTFFSVADPAFWEPAFTYMDLYRIPEAGYASGGRHYGSFTHDWRARPPMAWLDLLAEREIGLMRAAAPEPSRAPALIFLDESRFAAAVRDALRDYAHPDMLRQNPLTRSRMVGDTVGSQSSDAARVEALRRLLREGIERFQGTPRDTKLYRALYHTYLQPAPSQEQAAEILDLPFSTFRRHLKRGIERLTDHLWHHEIGEPS